MNNKTNNIVNLNNMRYNYIVTLINFNTGKQFSFTQSSVKLLVISDDVFNPFVSGYMIFENKLDSIHRSYMDGESVVDSGFNFNESGQDYLYVEITPSVGEKIESNLLSPEVWTLKYLFTIDSIESIEGGGSPDLKYKKLYLTDYRESIFKVKNIEFSTALLVDSDIPPSKRRDEDRMVKTGVAIKEIIKRTLGEGEKFNREWDEGMWDIFYTSTPLNKAIYDLEYVYNKHQSEEKEDFCILSIERYTDEWKLEPFSSITEKALDRFNDKKSGEYQLESFIISEVGQSPIIPDSTRVPTDYGSFLKNIHTPDYSNIDKFQLTDINYSDMSEHMTSVVIHNHNQKTGRFNVIHNDISDTKQFYDLNYSDNLKRAGFKNIGLFNIDNIRRNNTNIKHIYEQFEGNGLYMGRNKVLKASYMLNLAIDFTIKGLTHRKSGTFVSVSKNSKFVPSEYENRLQGQWFCTNVEHVFMGDSYVNNISAIKLNKFI